MKNGISILVALTLIFTIGIDCVAIASTEQLPDSSTQNREPPDCKRKPCK